MIFSQGSKMAGPRANYPQNLLRAHKMFRPRGPNGPWKCLLISMLDVLKILEKPKSGSEKKIVGIQFFIPGTEMIVEFFVVFWFLFFSLNLYRGYPLCDYGPYFAIKCKRQPISCTELNVMVHFYCTFPFSHGDFTRRLFFVTAMQNWM